MTTELEVRYLWVPHALGGRRIPPYERMRVSIRWQRYIEASLEALRDVELTNVEHDPSTYQGSATLRLTNPAPVPEAWRAEGALIELLDGVQVIAVGRVTAARTDDADVRIEQGPLTITVAEIRRALDVVLTDLEQLGATTWHIHKDYYWHVPADVRYEALDEPEALTMGSLSDDVEHTRKLAAGVDDPVPLNLAWIAEILRYAGERGPVRLVQLAEVEPVE